MRGSWVKLPTKRDETHECLPLTWKETIEEGLGYYGPDEAPVWKCPEPGCGREWLFWKRALGRSFGGLVVRKTFWENTITSEHLAVVVEDGSGSTWTEDHHTWMENL